MKLLVTMNDGTLAGQTFTLETGFLTIGRGQTCTIRLDPMTERIASKQHAFIEARHDGFYLTDNQSTNGTLRNGELIRSVKLTSDDVIQLGKNGVRATVQIRSETGESRSRHEFDQRQSERLDDLKERAPSGIQESLNGIGLRRPEARPASARTSLYVAIGVLLLLIPVLVTVVVLIMVQNVGPEVAVAASVIAFIPAMLYLIPMLWLDRYDPEPLWLLALAFTWGALVAVIVSYYVNTIFGQVIYQGTGSAEVADLASTLFSAPLIEESSKGLGLLILLIFFRRYFDDIVDGIVFGSVIALGFATVENVLYYGTGLNEAYIASGKVYGISDPELTSRAFWGFLTLFTIRGMFSPFAHAAFTSMTGIGCGIARESHKPFIRFIMPVVGYSLAVLLHVIWNGMSYAAILILDKYDMLGICDSLGLGGSDTGTCVFFLAYIVIQVPFFLLLTAFLTYIMSRQRRILREMLAIEVVRGLIPEEHARIATSAVQGQTWKWKGLLSGKYRVRSRYIRSIGKLGLSYWHIQRATAAQGETASFQQNPILRNEVLKWRDMV